VPEGVNTALPAAAAAAEIDLINLSSEVLK
jgi:hypothetical protein